MTKNVVMGSSPGLQAMYIRVIMTAMRETGMVKCTGATIVIIKGTGGMGCKMEMARFIL